MVPVAATLPSGTVMTVRAEAPLVLDGAVQVTESLVFHDAGVETFEMEKWHTRLCTRVKGPPYTSSCVPPSFGPSEGITPTTLDGGSKVKGVVPPKLLPPLNEMLKPTTRELDSSFTRGAMH